MAERQNFQVKKNTGDPKIILNWMQSTKFNMTVHGNFEIWKGATHLTFIVTSSFYKVKSY